MVVSVTASASGTPLSSPMRATPPDRMSSVAARIRSTAASTRLSRKITTGSTTTSRTTLPIQHRPMSDSSARGLVGKEEPAEDQGQGHPGGPQAQREALGGRGGRRGDLLGG